MGPEREATLVRGERSSGKWMTDDLMVFESSGPRVVFRLVDILVPWLSVVVSDSSSLSGFVSSQGWDLLANI